jgi:hypothetical protein
MRDLQTQPLLCPLPFTQHLVPSFGLLFYL